MRQREKGRGKICFPFFYLGCETSSRFHCQSPFCVCFWWGPPDAEEVTPLIPDSLWLTCLSLEHTFTVHYSFSYAQASFSQPLPFSFVTNPSHVFASLTQIYTRHTTNRHHSICGVRREGNPFCFAMWKKLGCMSFHHFLPSSQFSSLDHISANNKNVHSSTTLKRQVNSLNPPPIRYGTPH